MRAKNARARTCVCVCVCERDREEAGGGELRGRTGVATTISGAERSVAVCTCRERPPTTSATRVSVNWPSFSNIECTCDTFLGETEAHNDSAVLSQQTKRTECSRTRLMRITMLRIRLLLVYIGVCHKFSH
jgi:hypothetical protein